MSNGISSVFHLVGQFLILVGHCLMSIHCFKAWIPEILMITESWNLIAQMHISPHLTKSGSLNATFPWWLFPCIKLKIQVGSFQFFCWTKTPSIWLDERHNKPHPTKKMYSQMLSSLDNYIHTGKTLRSLNFF